MYGNTAEAADARTALNMEIIQKHVGPCREWIEEKFNRCNAPAEYVLWGKLIPDEGVGPRCYDHAAEHVGHEALSRNSGWALIDLGELAEKIDKAHFPLRERT